MYEIIEVVMIEFYEIHIIYAYPLEFNLTFIDIGFEITSCIDYY